MKLIADCHIHSNTSPDAKDSIDSLCQSAIEKGLKVICITNHHDIFPGEPVPSDFLLDFKAYTEEIEKARDKYSHKLEILKGVEFGSPHRHPKEFEEILNQDFDMIIASLHFLPMDYGIHWLWHSQETMVKEAGKYFVQRYYEEMEALTTASGFQVLAHMDYPKSKMPIFNEIHHVNEEIFKNLLKNKAVVEINTKAFTKGCDSFHPHPDLLAEYAEVGGKYLTIGSDAHTKEDVGAHFQKVESYLENENFEIGYFKQKKFIPISEK
ncbi:MAG: histidinol-phosphatase HisJ family protein [Clostridiales bacterium]